MSWWHCDGVTLNAVNRGVAQVGRFGPTWVPGHKRGWSGGRMILGTCSRQLRTRVGRLTLARTMPGGG